jgi:hypothetical protein
MFRQNTQHNNKVPGARVPVAPVAVTPTKPGPLPPGKKIAWTYNSDQKSIDRIYPGHTSAIIHKAFGKPDKVYGS